MTRTRMLVGLLALWATLTAGPALAGPEDEKDLARELATLKAEVRSLREELASMRRLGETSRKLDALEMTLLTQRLERLEKQVSGMSPSVSTRTASSFAPDSAVLTTGNVRLVNDLPVTASVALNGVSYSIAPLSSRTVRNLPAGTLVYDATGEGYGIKPPVRTTLGSNETVTIRVFPPRVFYP